MHDNYESKLQLKYSQMYDDDVFCIHEGDNSGDNILHSRVLSCKIINRYLISH